MMWIIIALGFLSSCLAQQPINTFSYEVVPTNQVGGNLIGSLVGGGVYFEDHDYGYSVKNLRAWTDAGSGGNDIFAIFFETFGGKQFVIGQLPARGPDAEITFAIGETLVGDYVLTDNGKASNLGHIDFKTSKAQEFKVGNAQRNFIFDSGDSYLMGFFGYSGDRVTQLGFYMMKPISSTVLSNVQYDFSSIQGKPPNFVTTQTLTNDTPVTQMQTVKNMQVTSVTDQFTVANSFSTTVGATVTAGIPVLMFQGSISVTTGTTTTSQITNFSSMATEIAQPETVPPCSEVIATSTWFEDAPDIPFTADEVFNFKDGSTATFNRTGTWKGVLKSDIIYNLMQLPLTNATGACVNFSPTPIVPPAVPPATTPPPVTPPVVPPTVPIPPPVTPPIVLPTVPFSPPVTVPTVQPTVPIPPPVTPPIVPPTVPFSPPVTVPTVYIPILFLFRV